MARPIARHPLLNGIARLCGNYVISMRVSQKVNRVIPRWNLLETISHSLLTLCGAMSNENLLCVNALPRGRRGLLGKSAETPRPFVCVLSLIPLPPVLPRVPQVQQGVPILLASCQHPCLPLLSSLLYLVNPSR